MTFIHSRDGVKIPTTNATDRTLMQGLLTVIPSVFAAVLLLAVVLAYGDRHASSATIFLLLGAAGALGTVYTALAVARLAMSRRRDVDVGSSKNAATDAT